MRVEEGHQINSHNNPYNRVIIVAVNINDSRLFVTLRLSTKLNILFSLFHTGRFQLFYEND